MIRVRSNTTHNALPLGLLILLPLSLGGVDVIASSLIGSGPEIAHEARDPGPSLAVSDGAWLELTPSGPPPSTRHSHTAIYDPVRDRMVMFGGGGAGYSNEVWELSLTGSLAWSQITPTGTPPSGRYGHSAIYDPVRDRMVVFGGFGGSDRNDVWALSQSGSPAWSQITPTGTPPSARQLHTAIYDPIRDRMVVFGGATGAVDHNDAWALTLSGSPAWSQLLPSGTPPAVRWSHTAIYDPVADRMVVFGGYVHGASDNDVWSLTLSGSPAWSQILPTGTPPSKRHRPTAVYDPVRDRMVVFAGDQGSLSLRNDTWGLSLSGSPGWSQLLPSGTLPTARVWHSAIYDPLDDRMVVFGGSGAGFVYRNDVWSLIWGETVGVENQPTLGDRLALAPPRPNPYRARVTFDFEVPRAAHFWLEVYDLRGRRVKTIEDALLGPGHHSRTWDGADRHGHPLPEGVYFVRLSIPGVAVRQKVVLTK